MPNGANQKEITLPDVKTLTVNFIAVLASKSYDSLGLLPKEGKKELNPGEAKLALDIMGPLFDIINPHLDSRENQDLRNMITTLRMHYVQVMGPKG